MLDILTLPDTVPYMQEEVTAVILHNQKDRWLFFLTVSIPQYNEAYTNSHWLALLDGSRAVHSKHKITQTCIM
jgi:hypothetical protein